MKQVFSLFILGSILYTAGVSGTNGAPNIPALIRALNLYEHEISWPASNNEIDLIDEFLSEIDKLRDSELPIRSTLEKADVSAEVADAQSHLLKANAILQAFSPRVREFFTERGIAVKIADDAWEINRNIKQVKNIPADVSEVLRGLCQRANISYDDVANGVMPDIYE